MRPRAKLIDLKDETAYRIRFTRKNGIARLMAQGYDPLTGNEIFVFVREAGPMAGGKLLLDEANLCHRPHSTAEADKWDV